MDLYPITGRDIMKCLEVKYNILRLTSDCLIKIDRHVGVFVERENWLCGALMCYPVLSHLVMSDSL